MHYCFSSDVADEQPALRAPRGAAHRDYVISSTAGPVTLTVFARQGPGPNQVQSTVSVVTWHGPN